MKAVRFLSKCKFLYSLVLSFLLLFGSFSVSAYASEDTNLIDSNMSNWGQFGANQATIRFLGNETNYIEASGSSHPILIYDFN